MGILEVSNVNKRFGGLQALGDVNLDIAEGTVHAIIGPNGAGKSTLLNVLVGKLIPDTGTVMFDGQSVLGRKPYEINQMGISRVFQTPEIFGDLTVSENMLIPCFAKRDGSFRMHALESMASEKEIIEICMLCAYCTGFGRFAAVYHAVEDLPESYQDTTAKTAPWSADHTERVVVPL